MSKKSKGPAPIQGQPPVGAEFVPGTDNRYVRPLPADQAFELPSTDSVAAQAVTNMANAVEAALAPEPDQPMQNEVGPVETFPKGDPFAAGRAEEEAKLRASFKTSNLAVHPGMRPAPGNQKQVDERTVEIVKP